MTSSIKKQNKKIISIIVAMDRNGLIGNGSKLPWKIPEDLKHFKEKTMGKFVLIGKKTYKFLPGKLPGRKIIVLSKEKDSSLEEVDVANSIEEALSLSSGEVMVAGGRSVYNQFLKIADRIYLTIIDKEFEGDVYFPEFNINDWRVVEEKKGENPLITYKTLVRRDSTPLIE